MRAIKAEEVKACPSTPTMAKKSSLEVTWVTSIFGIEGSG